MTTVPILPTLQQTQGDTWTIPFQYVDSTGAPISTAGYTVEIILHQPFTSPITVAGDNGGVTVVDAPTSQWIFVIEPALTISALPSGRQYDQSTRIQVVLVDGGGNRQTIAVQPIEVFVP